MNPTTISWVKGPDGAQGFSWNCFAGCSPNKPSPGCAKCWAERLAATRLAHLPAYDGLTSDKGLWSGRPGCTPGWTGEVRFFPEKLAEPLRRKKPSGIAVGIMGDIALLPFEQLSAIFGVMAACQQHRFYILTKRPERLREWFVWVGQRDHNGATRERITCAALSKISEDIRFSPLWGSISQRLIEHDEVWPLLNVFVGASASTQADLDRVAPEVLRIPAAVRFISYEPALEAITFKREWIGRFCGCGIPGDACDGWKSGRCDFEPPRISFVIAGGESGPNARPCHVDWLRSIVRQCREAAVAPWVKQLGSCSITPISLQGSDGWPEGTRLEEPLAYLNEKRTGYYTSGHRVVTRDRAGADMSEFPEDLRVREMPEVKP